MSIENLINNWSDVSIKGRMLTGQDAIKAFEDRNCIAFIAALWSGRSQLAFRELCKFVSSYPHVSTAIAVLDGDAPVVEQLIPKTFLADKGNGLILICKPGAPIQNASGSDLEDLRTILENYFKGNE